MKLLSAAEDPDKISIKVKYNIGKIVRKIIKMKSGSWLDTVFPYAQICRRKNMNRERKKSCYVSFHNADYWSCVHFYKGSERLMLLHIRLNCKK